MNGSLNWSRDGWQLNAGHRADQIALVQELYALHRISTAQHSYYDSGSSKRVVELSACECPHLWTLLERASRLDMPLIHTGLRAGRGFLVGRRRAGARCHARRGAGGEVLAADALRVGGRPAPRRRCGSSAARRTGSCALMGLTSRPERSRRAGGCGSCGWRGRRRRSLSGCCSVARCWRSRKPRSTGSRRSCARRFSGSLR